MRIVCEGLYNVRDLGGMAGADGRAVRSGLLLRGDQPFSATEADKRLPSDVARAALTKFFLADESYLRAAYDEADRLFGSFDAFLSQAVQLDGAKRQTLRALIIDAPERNAQPS